MEQFKRIVSKTIFIGLLFTAVPTGLYAHKSASNSCNHVCLDHSCNTCCKTIVKARKVVTNKLDVKKDAEVCGNLKVKGNIIKCPDSNVVCHTPWPAFPDPTVQAPIDLNDRVAIVTGISRSQGRAIGAALKAEGVTVIGTSRQAQGFPVPGQFKKPFFIPQIDPRTSTPEIPQACDFLLTLDITDIASIEAFVAEVNALFAGPLAGKNLDIMALQGAPSFRGSLIASVNAGGMALDNYFTAELANGINNSVLWARLFHLLRSDGYARIINTSSVNGSSRAFADFLSPYAAGKGVLRNLTATFLSELNLLFTQPQPGNPYKDLQVSNVSPFLMASTLGKLGPAGPLLGDNTPATQQFSGFLFYSQKLPMAVAPEVTADAYVQLCKMINPFLDVRITNDFWESFWEEVWCGSPEGLYPAARDCINLKSQLDIYTDIAARIIAKTPFGTCTLNDPEDWDIVSGTIRLKVGVGLPPTNDPNFEVVFYLNGVLQPGTLTFVPGGLVSNGVVIGSSYETDVDLSGFVGQVVTLQAEVTKFNGVPVPPNEFGTTFSRIINLMVE